MARGDDFSAPVPPDNPPRRRRPPAEPASEPASGDASRPASPPASGPASKGATHVANMQAAPQAPPLAGQIAPQVVPEPPPPPGPQLTVSTRLSHADLMHGRADPDADLAQSGVRLPRYVIDALRVVVATSRGQWNMQTVVREAVKAFIPPEILGDAWRQHGGGPPDR